MKKNKIKRFLKRNCINIPFYALLIVALAMISSLEIVPDQTAMKPVMVVQAATEDPAELITEAAAERCPVEDLDLEPCGCISSVEEMITVACDWYGIPEDVPLAIAKLETGNFTSAAYLQGNNVGGLSIDDIPIAYPYLIYGVDVFVANLAENYYAQGLDTVDEIAGKYCPAHADKWAAAVKELLEV